MEALKMNKKRIISLEQAKILLILVFISLIFGFCFFPLPTLANEAVEKAQNSEMAAEISAIIDETKADLGILNHLPENDAWQVKKAAYYTITAYNSEVSQCDSSPCITANGFNICEHGQEDTIAANFLYFGTKVRIPELFGDRIFVVRDRMNEKYSNHLDVWMLDKGAAKEFGIKLAKVEILE